MWFVRLAYKVKMCMDKGTDFDCPHYVHVTPTHITTPKTGRAWVIAECYALMHRATIN